MDKMNVKKALYAESNTLGGGSMRISGVDRSREFEAPQAATELAMIAMQLEQIIDDQRGCLSDLARTAELVFGPDSGLAQKTREIAA